MNDWEPYTQDERDRLADGVGFGCMLLTCAMVLLLIASLILSMPDMELHPLPSPQPIEMRD